MRSSATMSVSPQGGTPSHVAGKVCVVLGGGGFIGTNLCRTLQSAGARVRAVSRSRPFPEALTDVEWRFDSLNGDDLTSCIDGADVVFHLIGGGISELSNIDLVANASASILTTVRLLEVCRDRGVRRVAFASSGGAVYGIAREIPTPETAATNPILSYDINKITIEKYLSL